MHPHYAAQRVEVEVGRGIGLAGGRAAIPCHHGHHVVVEAGVVGILLRRGQVDLHCLEVLVAISVGNDVVGTVGVEGAEIFRVPLQGRLEHTVVLRIVLAGAGYLH